MDGEELDRYIAQFSPFKNRAEFTSEDPNAYAIRMQQSLLPEWPAEVLIEWLYRHAGGCLADYAPLRFERFQFHNDLNHNPISPLPLVGIGATLLHL